MTAQSEYAKTHDEIMKIQENLMKGFNNQSNDPNEQTHNNDSDEKSHKCDSTLLLAPNISSIKVISTKVLEDTIKGKYSLGNSSKTIGLCRYPRLSTIYYTNKKLFNVEALSKDELKTGLICDQEYEKLPADSLIFDNRLNDLAVSDLVGYQVQSLLNKETENLSIIEVQKVDSLPLITKPHCVINNQLEVYVSFDQFFLDCDYNLKEKLLFSSDINKNAIEYNKIDFDYFRQFEKAEKEFKLYNSGDLPVWGINIYTDDSNPLSILRQAAIYEDIKDGDNTVGCTLLGFELINRIKELKEPVKIYFDGRANKKEIANIDFILSLKYLPTLKNYYGNNPIFQKNGISSRSWYGSQFLSGHDGLSVVLWDVEFKV